MLETPLYLLKKSHHRTILMEDIMVSLHASVFERRSKNQVVPKVPTTHTKITPGRHEVGRHEQFSPTQ